jgi:hypothetical protein
MRAELHPVEDPERIVAVATWDGRKAFLEVLDDAFAGSLSGLFRPTPVVVDDGAHRRLGTRGEVLIEPGTLEWFRAAVSLRAAEVGLVARFVPGVYEGGWDPAAQYRTFGESIERLTST